MQQNGSQQVNASFSGTTVKETNPLGASAMINLAKIASSQSPSPQPQMTTTAIRPKLANLQPAQPQQLRPLQGATISLPAGINLPAGTVLMQNEKGHLVIVSRPIAPAPVQTIQPAIRPNIVNLVTQPTTVSQNIPLAANTVTPQATQILPNTAEISLRSSPLLIGEDVKKCKNFLETLLRLSSQQPPQTFASVKNLIQGLLDGSIPAEGFTTELQKELKSQKQPGLAPFLKKSLPELRDAVKARQLSIVGLGDEWLVKLQQSEHQTSDKKPNPTQIIAQVKASPSIGTITNASIQQTAVNISPAPVNIVQMPGVINHSIQALPDVKPQLIQPSITQPLGSQQEAGSHSVPGDQKFLNFSSLHRQINSILSGTGIKKVNSEVFNLLADSCKELIKDIVIKTIVAAEHRLEIYRNDNQLVQVSDVRTQLRFLEQLEKMEKQRKDDQERETLIRAAKSRTKTEDPEQVKLKQKAKEMQQAELEIVRQRDANLTALAAIGPRKRKQDESLPSSSVTPAFGGLASVTTTNDTQITMAVRPRFKKLNLRDILYVSEMDQHLSKSLILYKSHVR